MLTKSLLMTVFVSSCLIMSSSATASERVKVTLDSKSSVQDGQLAEGLMNSFYLAGLVPRITFNETGTIEVTNIGIDQMSCAYEGLVDSPSHRSKTLIASNYVCEENDAHFPHVLSAGSSYHIIKAVEKVVRSKSTLVGAASFIVEEISCKGEFNVFPEPAGTRDYFCEFDVNVMYEAE